MGQTYKFQCQKCEYLAEVSGDDDGGMEILTTTILCEDCSTLYDVVIGKPGKDQPIITYKERCPTSSRHKVHPWKAGGPCPKCGEPLKNIGMSCLWD